MEDFHWVLMTLLGHPKVTKSQKIYLESVQRYVELNPLIYPTPAQSKIVYNIAKHYERLDKEDLLGDCY